MNIFKKKRTPKSIGESVGDAGQAFFAKQNDDTSSTLAKRINEALMLVYGTTAAPARLEDSAVLATTLIGNNAMLSLLPLLAQMPFEARKEYSELFCFLTTNDLAGFATSYLMSRKAWVLETLVMSYKVSDIALMCGEMLRACFKYEDLSREMLFSTDMVLLDKFFEEYLVDTLFDVSSDAFATFRTALTSCRDLVSQFLAEKFELFFDRYNRLLVSESYMTQRQALKLLSQILLDRHNFRSMMRYIGDKNNLRIVMNLLRVNDKGIQHETFDVFKVFVANPNRTPEVNNTLLRNRDKIVAYLQAFKPERDVEAVVEEKNLLINSMLSLKLQDSAPPTPATEGAPPAAAADGDGAAAAAAAPAPATAAPAGAPADATSGEGAAAAVGTVSEPPPPVARSTSAPVAVSAAAAAATPDGGAGAPAPTPDGAGAAAAATPAGAATPDGAGTAAAATPPVAPAGSVDGAC